MSAEDDGPIALTSVAIRGVVAIILGVAVNAVIVTVALEVPAVEPFGALSHGPVSFLTGWGTLAATAVYGLTTRVWPRPDELFIKIAVLALLVSFLPTLGVLYADPEATASAVAVLLLLHVTTAAICVGMLTDRYSPLAR